MLRILFYIPPFLMNIITGLIFFVPARRLAAANESAVAVAAAMSAWAVTYTVTSITLGFVQNKKNAVKLILLGQSLSIIALAGLLTVSDIKLQYYWLMLTGFSTVLFYCPFQVIMSALEKNVKGTAALIRSTSFYTFSWSLGLAAGPVAAAAIWGLFDPATGWKVCYIFCMALNVIITVICLFLHAYVKKVNQEEENSLVENTVSETPLCPENEKKLPDFAIDGWALGIGGYLTVYMLRSLLPYRGEVIGLSTTQMGILIGMIAFMQAVTAFALYKSRTWMYKPIPVLIPLAGGIIGLVLAATVSNFYVLFASMFIYGIFSGIFAWDMIYHAIAIEEKRARYVSVNETIVGVFGILSPLAGGLFATPEKSGLPFLIGAGVLIFAAAFHVVYSVRYQIRK
ncbi:MAG: MFS transporter [Lentisphaeria bacterium]|nr:MFS transporter [Lentisphaeria bacterium]